MKLLCISDVHGHAERLQKALQLGDSHGTSMVLVAGDLCFPGPKPLATWKLLTAVHANCVLGTSDLALARLNLDELEPADEQEKQRLQRAREVRTELGEIIVKRLGQLPRSFRLDLEDGSELLLVHGSPVDPFTPITHDMTDDEVRELLGDETAELVLCGASHVPFERTVGDVHIVGLGSVGEAPTPHVMHVTVIETDSAGYRVKPLSIVLHDEEDESGKDEGTAVDGSSGDGEKG